MLLPPPSLSLSFGLCFCLLVAYSPPPSSLSLSLSLSLSHTHIHTHTHTGKEEVQRRRERWCREGRESWEGEREDGQIDSDRNTCVQDSLAGSAALASGSPRISTKTLHPQISQVSSLQEASDWMMLSQLSRFVKRPTRRPFKPITRAAGMVGQKTWQGVHACKYTQLWPAVCRVQVIGVISLLLEGR